MEHSLHPRPVKEEPSELEPITKRKSHSESKDENTEKKPTLIKPEKMNSGESSRSLCGICFNSKPDRDMFKINSCNHSFCVDCISKYVKSQINNSVVKVICPNPNCYGKLKPDDLKNIMSGEFIDRWEFAKYKSKIPMEQKTYCPYDNCSILLVNDNYGGEVALTSCECPYCHRLFCAQCRVPWHAEMNCQEFLKSKVPKQEPDLDEKEEGQKCPDCSIYVKRINGCDEMVCRCKCLFCYHCGKKKNFNKLHVCDGLYY